MKPETGLSASVCMDRAQCNSFPQLLLVDEKVQVTLHM